MAYYTLYGSNMQSSISYQKYSKKKAGEYNVWQTATLFALVQYLSCALQYGSKGSIGQLLHRQFLFDAKYCGCGGTLPQYHKYERQCE
jgi:hypothetical protein